MGKKQRMLCVLLAVLLMVSMLAGCSGKAAPAAQPSAAATAAIVAKAKSGDNYKVTIDVNPSIELTVTDGLVTGATAFNDDGQGIVLSVNTTGMTPDAAVTAIVKELASSGYINNTAEVRPYLIITVSKNGVTDEQKTEELKDTAEKTLEELKLECRIGTADVTSEDVAAAASLNISVGRYVLLKYIAAKEGITIEQAIATYGSMKIGELMDMYKEAEDLFKEDDDNGRGDFLSTLTPEQVQAVNSAIKTFKAELKTAEKAFHNTVKQMKKTYSGQVKAIRKSGSDAAAIQAQLDALKQKMLDERTAALGVLTAAVNAAKDKCIAAVSSVPLNKDLFNSYLARLANKEIQKEEGFNDLLHLFGYHDADDQDEDDNEQGEHRQKKDKQDEDKGQKDKGHQDQNEQDDEHEQDED